MPRIRALVALAVVIALTAACGTRLSEQEQALARAGGSDRSSPTVAGEVIDGDDDALGESAVPGEVDGAVDGGTATDGGTVDGGGTAPGGPTTASCRGKTASDVGVTPTSITVGNIATMGGPVPGFGQTGRNGLRAFIAMVNASGGICGRKLVMAPGDDRLDPGANKAETERLMKQVFAFVSNTSVADDGGAGILKDTDIALVGLGTSPAAGALPNLFSPSPLDPDATGNGASGTVAYFKKKYSLKAAAVVWPAAPVARSAAQRYIADLKANGLAVPIQREVAITETNYSGVAADIHNKNIDIVISVLEFNGIARLARALETEGYQPKVPFYGAQTYGRKFLEIAGTAAEGVKLAIAFEPFEMRSKIPEMDLFLEWYERTNPGQDVDFFSIMAWVSARMFADALAKAGAEPTRKSLLAQLRTFTDVTANNMLGHINPAQKRPARCFLVVEVIDGKWVKTEPTGVGFKC